MQIEFDDKFGAIFALRNAIRTFKMFIEDHCENVRCYECHFKYDVVEGEYVCPNCELGLSDDIEILEKLLKQFEEAKE